MGDDFTWQLTWERNGINEEFLESLRIWPQTRICYATMQDGSVKVLAIGITKLHHLNNPVDCDEYGWNVNVIWHTE